LAISQGAPCHPGFGSSSLSASHFRAMIAPNNSFNPNPLRSTNNIADRACHVVGYTTQVGLTQALAVRGRFSWTERLGQSFSVWLACCSAFCPLKPSSNLWLGGRSRLAEIGPVLG